MPRLHAWRVWIAITLAWNRLHHAANAIKERCAEGFFTVSNRNNPSTTKKLRNIGSHSLLFICTSQLLLVWFTQQTPMRSVKGCPDRHSPKPCSSFKATSPRRKPANGTSPPAAGPSASSVPAAEIGGLISYRISAGGSVLVAATKSR